MRIERELAVRRAPAALGAAASLRLLQGSPGAALRLLDEALAQAPGDVRLLVDRAAAQLQADLVDDLAADIASIADRFGGPPPAVGTAAWHFNRALLLERLGLPAEAAVAFRAAARVGDGWADEAATRALKLERAASPSWEGSDRQRLLEAVARQDSAAVASLVERWPAAAGALVEEDLLGALDASDSGYRLKQAELIASALARRGDSFLVDSLATLRRTPELARAHGDYARGRLHQRQGLPEKAQALFADAAVAFAREGSPFAALADLRWASSGHQLGQYGQAVDRVQRALRQTDPSYLDLRARLEWLGGLLEIVGGNPAAALDEYRRALELYERAGVEEGVATVGMLIGETWWLLGESREAWRHRRHALRRLTRVSDAERRRTILDEAADASAGDGLLTLASVLQNRVVASARTADNDFAFALALAERARIRNRHGDRSGALADLSAARRDLGSLPQNAFREHLLAYVSRIEAETLQATAPRRAIEKLDAAAVYYERMERWMTVRTIVIERAQCRLRHGNEEGALVDLKIANAISQRVREQGGPDRVRGALDEQAQPLYTELVRLEFERDRVEEAFTYAEGARAQRLADALGAEQVSLPDLRGLLPPATALVAYHDLGLRLVAFVVRRERAAVVDLGRPDLKVVSILRRTIEEFAVHESSRSPLAALEARLIAPLRPHLSGVRTLVIVPHRELFGVPFSALYDSTRRRYLVQDYRLQVAPSATAFVAALARSMAQDRGTGMVLAVSVAAAPPGFSSLLAPLPRAIDEARAVAAAYPDAQLLEGKLATKSRFLERARRSGIVHFAGHSVATAVDPSLSFLVFRSQPGDVGALYADELASHSWPLTRLVVLSACRSASSSKPDSEGVQGLARAFLAAGVPAVVGTLWNIDDRTAHHITVRFHRGYAAGLDAASALRAAQLSILQEQPQAPPTWSAFEVIGGVAETTIH